jgi:hypothetical protein
MSDEEERLRHSSFLPQQRQIVPASFVDGPQETLLGRARKQSANWFEGLPCPQGRRAKHQFRVLAARGDRLRHRLRILPTSLGQRPFVVFLAGAGALGLGVAQ